MARYDAHARCVSPNLRGSHPPASVRRLASTRFGQPSYGSTSASGGARAPRAHTRYRTDSNRSSRIPPKRKRTHLILPSDGKEKDEADNNFLSAFWGRRLRLAWRHTDAHLEHRSGAGGVVIATRPHRHDRARVGTSTRPVLACVRVRAELMAFASGCRLAGPVSCGCPSMRVRLYRVGTTV